MSILVTDESLLTSVFCEVQTEPCKGLNVDQWEAVTTNMKQNSCDQDRSQKPGALTHDCGTQEFISKGNTAAEPNKPELNSGCFNSLSGYF